eukprot:gene17663-20118_t
MATPVGEYNTPAASSIIETSLFLCQCIEEWQRAQTDEKCDGRLDWDEIAVYMSNRTGKAVNKGDLQTVWKFIAYGKHFDRSAPEQSITYSDDEDAYYQPFTAVKRNKIFVNTCAAAAACPEIPIEKKNNLPSSVPDVLNTKHLGKHIKVDIPQHVLHGSCGLHPPLYMSSGEITNKGPTRFPRISVLSAQGNPAFSSVLKLSERTFQSSMHLQAVAARSGSVPLGTTPIRPAPATAAVKARVNTVPMNRVGTVATNVAVAPRVVPVAAAGTMAAAHQAQLKRLAAAAGIQNSGSVAPAAKKPYVLSQSAGSSGQATIGQSASAVKRPVVVLPARVNTLPTGPTTGMLTSHVGVPSVPPTQELDSAVVGPLVSVPAVLVTPVTATGAGLTSEQPVTNNATPHTHESGISPNV